MRIQKKHDPVLLIGKKFKLKELGIKQLNISLVALIIWILVLLSVDYHNISTYILTAILLWFTWVELVRFWAIPSTWCSRCRKRKYIREMIEPEEGRSIPVCSECYKKFKKVDDSMKVINSKMDHLLKVFKRNVKPEDIKIE